jgi:hypothetical protein
LQLDRIEESANRDLIFITSPEYIQPGCDYYC